MQNRFTFVVFQQNFDLLERKSRYRDFRYWQIDQHSEIARQITVTAFTVFRQGGEAVGTTELVDNSV